MSDSYNNPHPPFPAPDISENDSLCDLGCIERFTPKRLKGSELFQSVNFLSCYYENVWSDEELRAYLIELEEFFRKSLDGNLSILNWFSLVNWLETTNASWEAPSSGSIGIGHDDFYSRYDLSTREVWLSMSKANGGDFNEEGFKYMEWMLHPYVGTNLIQRKILEKLQIDGEVVDWYQNKNIINAYSFVIDEFPGWEKARLLIINSKLLKNAESILISLRDSRCPTRLLLSNGGHLDRDFLSDISTLSFEGVHICFQRFCKKHLELLPNDNLEILFSGLSSHLYGVDYFRTTELSIDMELDGLSDRTVFSTKTNIWPTKNIQLLPAHSGLLGGWSSATTWEDHYKWGNIDVTNLIRTVLPYDGFFVGMGWTNTANWERWSDWHGEQNSSWNYLKPILNSPDPRREYFENKNYIPSFSPIDGKSLYRPIIISARTRTHVEGVWNNRSQIINYWNEYMLSENEFLSPEIEQVPQKRKNVYLSHISLGKGFLVDVADYSTVFDHDSIENINSHKAYLKNIINFKAFIEIIEQLSIYDDEINKIKQSELYKHHTTI